MLRYCYSIKKNKIMEGKNSSVGRFAERAKQDVSPRTFKLRLLCSIVSSYLVF